LLVILKEREGGGRPGRKNNQEVENICWQLASETVQWVALRGEFGVSFN